MTEKHKPRRDENETVSLDPGVVSEVEFASLTAKDRQRALVISRLVVLERAEKFVDWYMSLDDDSEIKIGLAVNADIRAPKAIIVLCNEVTWTFTADEVVFLIHSLEQIRAKWTASTGRDVPRMAKYLVYGLRVCHGKLIDFTADEIDEMEEGLQTDEYGRDFYDQNVKDLTPKRRPKN